MKRLFLVTCLALTLLLFPGCRKSDSNLGQFVGTWEASYSLYDPTGVRISSGSIAIKQPSSDAISFGESSSVVTGVGPFGVPNMQTKSYEVTLKQPSSGQYQLSLTVDSTKLLENFPLTHSSEGFSGRQPVPLDDKQRVVVASIKPKGEGHVWKITADTGDGPKRDYEFELKKKTG